MACFGELWRLGEVIYTGITQVGKSFNTINDLYMWRIIFMYVTMKKEILEKEWVQYDTSG